MGPVENPSVPCFRLRCERTPLDGSRMVRFLGPWQSCFVHWLAGKPKGRTYPCGGLGRCDKAIHTKEKEWRAFAPAAWWNETDSGVWVPCVFEVTDNLANFMRGHKLTGELWEVFRQRSDGNNRECAGVYISSGAPPAFDTTCWVQSVCYRLWNTDVVEWGVEPTLPAPISLEAVNDSPPPRSVRATERQSMPTTETIRAFTAKLRAAGVEAGKAGKT